jgi:hypothetical protein
VSADKKKPAKADIKSEAAKPVAKAKAAANGKKRKAS